MRGICQESGKNTINLKKIGFFFGQFEIISYICIVKEIKSVINN